MMVGQCAALFVCLFHMQMLKANQISGILFITDMLYHLQCNAMQCNTIYGRQIVHHSKEKTTKINVYNAMQCNAMQCNAIELYS